jgi:hypothetical protein
VGLALAVGAGVLAGERAAAAPPEAAPDRSFLQGTEKGSPHPAGDTLGVDRRRTILAVVVRTAGLAARFAPDHLIHAGDHELTLVLDPERPQEARFSGRIPVEGLVVDDPDLQREVEERLVELGLLDDPYDEMSSGDRDRVRRSMLGEGQLHAAGFPWIQVEVEEVQPSEADPAFPWTVRAALTIREARVEIPFSARLDGSGVRARVEAFGSARFSDFGIEPYRAFLGAVRNRDEFHLYLRLETDPGDGGEGGISDGRASPPGTERAPAGKQGPRPSCGFRTRSSSPGSAPGFR